MKKNYLKHATLILKLPFELRSKVANSMAFKQQIFVGLYLLVLLVGSQSYAQKVYDENGGIVLMEAENTLSPLDLWINSTFFPSYSGMGHIEFSGGVVSGSGSPTSPIIYKFKINTAGDYALNIRGRSRLLAGEASDLGNDVWVKVEGDYTVGAGGPPDMSWLNQFTKVFVGRGGNGDWGWGTKYDINHVQPNAIFNFKAGETYTLTLAGRSQRFNIDRILFVKTDYPITTARALTTESTSFDDGVAVERYYYEALNHFSEINAGEVPYYKDSSRLALAINASIETDRDKFAKATTIFTGKSGTYNVKLTTLAEFDGECTYRILVNGNVVGTYQNKPVSVANDYQLQTVVFQSIAINKDDVIAVESNTHTNGLIPEGSGTAWARGRWKSIAMNPTVYQGRIAVVADGNYRDSDDIAGTPISLAILRAMGLEDKLVHYSHSCDLVPGGSDPGGAFREVEMQLSADGTATRWGGFNHITFFNCQTQKAAAISDLKDKINASTATDPLWIIEAGEPDIIWEAVNAADVAKRVFVYMITHHPANDVGDVYDLSDVMSLGIPSVNLHSIPDQNTLLKKPLSDWYWARDYTDERIKWLWDRGFEAQKTYMNYPAIVGKFDCSDAGMVYYWATIIEGGDVACDVPKLKALFSNYIPAIPPDANFVKPTHGQVFETGSNIEVEAAPSIDASQIASIELFVNDVSVRSITTAPFKWGSPGQMDSLLENMVEGSYVLRLLITNTNSNTSQSSITVSCVTPVIPQGHEPFGGTPRNIPGKIEIEDYDLGGPGIAFQDGTPGNSGGSYRIAAGEDVDITEGGTGYISTALAGGEFTRYIVNISESGAYRMLVNYKTLSATSKPFAAYILPMDLTTSVELFSAPNGSTTSGIRNSGGAFINYISSEFNLTVGTKVLELRIPSGGAGPNYDYVTIEKASALGIDDVLLKQSSLKVYPLPSHDGKFNLSKAQKWNLYSLLGVKILQGDGASVDVSKYSKGIYILKTDSGITKKLLFN